MYGNRRRKVLFSLIAFSALSGFCFFESGVFDDGAGGGYSPKSKSPAPQGGIIGKVDVVIVARKCQS